MMFNTPILLITFNRPSHTRKVLEVIREQKPKQLFVFQDGARDGNEIDAVKCAEVCNVVKELVDWDCNLQTYYSDVNLGCGPGPAAAITWFFENVEEGIILEDDCIPHKDFFMYCQELLEKYRDNNKISFIGGCSFYKDIKENCSYSFVGGHHMTWGWATWKRVWSNFDYDLKSINEKKIKVIIKQYYKSTRQREYWYKIFEEAKYNKMNNSCWDYQFYFSCWSLNQYAISPCVNLVSNIGYGDDATHTNSKDNNLLDCITYPIHPIKHPKKIWYNYKIDYYMMKNMIIPYQYGIKGFLRLPYRLNSRLKRLLNHKGSWIKRK